MARYVFITGGVVSSLGKGLASAALGALLQARGYKVRLRKLDPYLNVDPGTMSPVSARRGLRHRRRRRDRSRSRPLRALHRPSRQQAGQHHDRPHLSGHPRQGTPRRLSRRHRSRSFPHVTNAIKDFIRDGNDGFDFVLVRDRRHGRRHRGPAVLRGDPPVRQRTAARTRGLHPSDAAAVHPERRRTEDQADAAFGEGTALDRHPARHPAVPHRPRQFRRRNGASSRCSATCARAR